MDFAGAFAGVNYAFNELIGLTKRAIGSMVNFGKQAVQSFSHFQQLESSLQGLMRSEEKGTELFEHLRAFSFDTTFGVDTLASASQQLLGVGIAVEDLDSTLMMMGNVAQGDTQKFMELVSVFAKIQNQGKASSIQLQQLALRGVPIYQMLKQMGIEGTATGEDIRKAFENMTSAGGQFEGAMERINNTIQGREGFVSDTWREFLTSFAEASGLADIYAKALDIVYDALQGIVDWLQKINENPVYQAVFRGVLVTMLGAIGSTLALKFIPVIATLIKSIVSLTGVMTAFNATNPFGWVAIGVSAIAGLITYYKNLKKEAKEYADIDKENMQRYTIEELMKKWNNEKKRKEMSNEDVYTLAKYQKEYWEEQKKLAIEEKDEGDYAYADEQISMWTRELTKRIIALRQNVKPDWYKEPTKEPTETSEEVAQEEKINDLMKDRIKLFQDYLKEKQKIENELALLGLEGEALLKLKYIQEGFTEEQAEVLASEQHKLDLLNEEIEKQKQLAEQAEREAEARKELEKNAKYSLSGLQNLMKEDGNVAGYYGVDLLQQTSAGSIVNGAMQGAEIGGLWGAIAGGLTSAVMQLDGFQKLLNGVNKFISLLLEPLNGVFNWLAKILGLDTDINDEKEKELETLKKVNEQYRDLQKAIEDNEAYYKNRRQLLANDINKNYLETKSVNDMIITPQGNFSTHPDDYIIATKNPNGLGNGNLNVIVNDYAGVKVDTQKVQNGEMTNLILTISKKVAGDYATGQNGWDNAIASRSLRNAGTSYSK